MQAQVLEVLRLAREATGAALVMITHDLGVIAGLADRVAVMYAGRLVEQGEVHDVLRASPDALHAGPAGIDPPRGRVGSRAAGPDSRQPPLPGLAAARVPVLAPLPAGH